MLKVAALRNGFTYGNQIVSSIRGNCFKTSPLLMENTFGRASKFVRAFPFGQTVFLLIYSKGSSLRNQPTEIQRWI